VIQQRQALGIATLTSERLLATRRLSAFVEAQQGLSGGIDAALAAEADPEISERRLIAAIDKVVEIDLQLVEQGHVAELFDELITMAVLQPMPALSMEPRQRLKALRQRLRGLGAMLTLVPPGHLVGLQLLRLEFRHTMADIEFAVRQRDRLLGRDRAHNRQGRSPCD
jgi:hypothetical protein